MAEDWVDTIVRDVETQPSMPALTTLTVRELRIAADVGVLPHEIGNPQTLVVTIVVLVPAVISDRLADTVDYTVFADAAEMLGRTRIALIETFAHRLGCLCLQNPLVQEADILVEKPGAIPNAMVSARVVMTRDGRRVS